MNSGIGGQVVNYKYWQRLKSVDTAQKETRPSKEAIEFEQHLQELEQANKLYEMGLAMKRASLRTSKDFICSVEALRYCEQHSNPRKSIDHNWYLTKDKVVDDEEDQRNDDLLAVVTPNPEYHAIVQPIYKKITNKEQL
ncbi:uncharacterized protein [Watersipora subatra]|uniref:uncharacterized protein n=1 Tax=Watersipora subatra TaxID=2589382 RepID=UPI00355B19E6